MQKDLKFVLLLDCYGEFLTPHQASMIEQYYCQDLSLGEIAALSGITRQGVHNGIKRGEQQLLAMEQKLQFASRLQALDQGLNQIAQNLDAIASAAPDNPQVQKLCNETKALSKQLQAESK